MGMPYVSIPEMRGGELDLASARKISRKDFEEWTKKAKPEAFDVVLSRRCNPGETAFVRPGMQFALGQNLVLLRSNGERVYPPFLRWLARSPHWWEQVETFLNVGAVFDSLRCADVPKFRLPVPGKAEQAAISTLLGALDDKIELNRRTNETLEALARAIFRDWFVDFGPTRAKAEGREPYLAPELWDLFPDRLDAEGKPEGWVWTTVGNFFRLTMGQSPPGSTYNDAGEGLPFFQGRTDFGFRYPTNRKYCSAPTRIAQAGDTLVSVRAPVGDINLSWERCCIGRGVSAISHAEGLESFTYYSAWGLQLELKKYEHTGTVFGSINKKQFAALEVIDPGSTLITLFEDVVSPLDARIRSNTAESRTLAQTRDLLLPKLMSGEIRLKDAGKMAEALL